MEEYNPQKIEAKWQRFWEENKINACDLNDQTKHKFYNLVMFFYPSGDKIHIGHVYNYTGADVYGRYKRLKGLNVFEPMGYDAFGLPAENYAIKTGVHPASSTQKNIEYSKKQLKRMGFMYDWEKEINTSSPEYYKWTQWLFGVLYKAGLAYHKKAPVNWCPACKTVLANEQVVNGRCERCGEQVIQRDLKQWFFKITAYADKLLEGHKKINWPKKTILMQKNWIGRSEGAEVIFKVKNEGQASVSETKKLKELRVFTTRPDTLFGVTFMVVAPEHPLINDPELNIKNQDEVKKYIDASKKKTALERTDLSKEKSGLELKGIKAINPVNNKEIPIFVADYVMLDYGTGAIMAVPAHDQRDWEFARKYGLEIIEVIKPLANNNQQPLAAGGKNECFSGEGIVINSGEFNGLTSQELKEKITKWLEKKGLGKRAVNYKLRDWLISRQRYWGAPIPLVFCENCANKIKNQKSKAKNNEFNKGELQNPGWILVPENQLPVRLPDLENFKPTDKGESPLARVENFVNVKCPKCGRPAKRSTETMDTFVCSSWYFLRFLSPHLNERPFDQELIKKWLPVDQYCGGAEHACLHLLYARFITKVLADQKLIDFDEPFIKLNHQGMILAEDGNKMSKSKGNVVSPDDYVKKYGADVFRLHILFLAPFDEGGRWNDRGILGVKRFLERVWKLQYKIIKNQELNAEDSNLNRIIHQTVKKVTQDIENFHFNTAISQLMILLNEMEKQDSLAAEHYSLFIKLLSPFAPHICEELWERLGNNKNKSIFNEKWPAYAEKFVQKQEIELVIQINGKLRDKIKAPADISEETAVRLAKDSKKIQKWLGNKTPKRIIFIKGKLLNIVI